MSFRLVTISRTDDFHESLSLMNVMEHNDEGTIRDLDWRFADASRNVEGTWLKTKDYVYTESRLYEILKTNCQRRARENTYQRKGVIQRCASEHWLRLVREYREVNIKRCSVSGQSASVHAGVRCQEWIHTLQKNENGKQVDWKWGALDDIWSMIQASRWKAISVQRRHCLLE